MKLVEVAPDPDFERRIKKFILELSQLLEGDDRFSTTVSHMTSGYSVLVKLQVPRGRVYRLDIYASRYADDSAKPVVITTFNNAAYGGGQASLHRDLDAASVYDFIKSLSR